MKKCTSLFISLSVAVVISLLSIGIVYCQENRTPKSVESLNTVFDFRKDDPKAVATYLNFIHQTFIGVKNTIAENTDFVIVFTGSAVKYLSTNNDAFSGDVQEILDNIALKVAAMSKDGIRMEICLFAARLAGIEPDSILPEIDQIENGWLSLIGYQANGYSLLPLY